MTRLKPGLKQHSTCASEHSTIRTDELLLGMKVAARERMGSLEWYAVGTFFATLVTPFLWLPFLALLIALLINQLNPTKQAKPLPIQAKYGDLDNSVVTISTT